ncbi:MAG: hypothetical protein FWE69_07970 [Clostridiales bacterium]|nr:hypothetical protein [Clostridiales bacterium]
MKTYLCTVIDDMHYMGCLMRIDDAKITIRLFWKKFTILFENILSIVVYDDGWTIGIEYKNIGRVDYIRIRMLRPERLLSILEAKTSIAPERP